MRILLGTLYHTVCVQRFFFIVYFFAIRARRTIRGSRIRVYLILDIHYAVYTPRTTV